MRDDAEILETATQLLIARDDAAARACLLNLSLTDPVPTPIVTAVYERDRRSDIPPRPKMPPARLAPILQRDRWQCHYCSRRLVLAPVIAAVGALCPNAFPFESHAMHRDHTHPAAERVYPNVDHVLAGGASGNWHDPANLVAACTKCNEKKSDWSGWSALSFERRDWDGLTGSYAALLERFPKYTRSQRDWARALGIALRAH